MAGRSRYNNNGNFSLIKNTNYLPQTILPLQTKKARNVLVHQYLMICSVFHCRPIFYIPSCINSHMQEGTVLQSTKNIQDNSEHKKRLLLDILKERGIFFDLETKKIIDDKTISILFCEFYRVRKKGR